MSQICSAVYAQAHLGASKNKSTAPEVRLASPVCRYRIKKPLMKPPAALVQTCVLSACCLWSSTVQRGRSAVFLSLEIGLVLASAFLLQATQSYVPRLQPVRTSSIRNEASDQFQFLSQARHNWKCIYSGYSDSGISIGVLHQVGRGSRETHPALHTSQVIMLCISDPAAAVNAGQRGLSARLPARQRLPM